MTVGFVLRRLRVTGPGVPAGEVTFSRGLNVIAGPSDTGKTFIAQCIDYVMGSGTAPKEIPEAARYTIASLEIEAPDGARVVLHRALRGGDVTLSADGQTDQVLAAKHQPGKDDTVSSLLLKLSGLVGKVVRTNQQGKTRALSFRDIARLVLIDEESVISTESPILTGQVINRTVENSVFRLVLTGVDDSSVVARPDPKVAKGRQEGKVEVLEALLDKARGILVESAITIGTEAARSALTRLDAAVEAASAALATEQSSVSAVENQRRVAWTRLRKAESRMDVLSELQKRFELLRDVYASDLKRLAAIAEASERLGQMNEERCPVCGALAEHHESEHKHEHAAPSDVRQGCNAESEKITRLVQDLQTTLRDNAAEVERLRIEREARQAELAAAGAEVKDSLQPRLQEAVRSFREVHGQRAAARQALGALERVEELERLLNEAKAAPTKSERADGPATAVRSGEAEEFSKRVETLLRSWRFPNLDRVTFSETDQDIVISGRARGSHGKGVRALTRAAFNLALLRYCADTARPFPGVVLIDSPLVVYREPESKDFPLEVKPAFYASVAERFRDAQVIILENDEPPPSVAQTANVVTFTGSDHGRRGFLPT